MATNMDIKNRINRLTDKELLNLIEKEYSNYTEDAQSIAKEVLKKRGGLEALKEKVERDNREWIEARKKEEELQHKENVEKKKKRLNTGIILFATITFITGLYFSIIGLKTAKSELFGEKVVKSLLEKYYNIPSYTQLLDILVFLIATTIGIILIISSIKFFRLRKSAILWSKISFITLLIFIIWEFIVDLYKILGYYSVILDESYNVVTSIHELNLGEKVISAKYTVGIIEINHPFLAVIWCLLCLISLYSYFTKNRINKISWKSSKESK